MAEVADIAEVSRRMQEPSEPVVTGRPALPREEFWNLPNTITVFRIACVPILLFLPWTLDKAGSQFMAWVYIVAAASDILDGWLARRGALVTRMGKLLDPLADKLLVATSLIMLLAVGRIPLWASPMVVVIVGRELAVTGLRGMASADGHIMAANPAGKAKALCQNIAIGALLFHYTTIGLPAHTVGMTLLAVASVLTLWSGYVYFADYLGWSIPGRPAPTPSDGEAAGPDAER